VDKHLKRLENLADEILDDLDDKKVSIFETAPPIEKAKVYCMILQTIIKIKKEGFGQRTING